MLKRYSLLALICAWGTLRAFQTRSPDLAVFYSSWRNVLEGTGEQIYTSGPDRFLYAPGFAWLFAPLGLLPIEVVLLGLCALKFWILAVLLRDAHAAASENQRRLLPFAPLLVAKPLLIDFQYGQVNLLILGACAFALASLWKAKPSLTAWGALGFFAVAKLFPLPILLAPLLHRGPLGIAARRMLMAAIGGGLALFLPIGTEGFFPGLELLWAWRDALLSKGLPLDSHNQSFAAFLWHYFSGVPTRVLFLSEQPVFGVAWLSSAQIRALTMLWAAGFALVILLWLARLRSIDPRERERWIVVLLALLILPSHLVWKPYFVMAYPLALHLTAQAQGRIALRWLLVVVFVGMNLSGFDFVGKSWGARLEGGAILLWSHLLLLAGALWLGRIDRRALPS